MPPAHNRPVPKHIRPLLGRRPDTELAERFGLSPLTIAAYRRSIGLLLQPRTKVDWDSPRVRRLLGRETDEVAAKHLGVTDRTIRDQRRRLGIAPSRDRRWTPMVIAMLGKTPDRIVALLSGALPDVVAYQRKKRGIPEFVEPGREDKPGKKRPKKRG